MLRINIPKVRIRYSPFDNGSYACLRSGWFCSLRSFLHPVGYSLKEKPLKSCDYQGSSSWNVVPSGLEPELFWSRNRRVANYTTGQYYGWPVKARTWTLLDQNQTCCQLHHGSINNVLLFKTAAKVRSFFSPQTDLAIKMVIIWFFVDLAALCSRIIQALYF